ncbi:hypothetical protein HRI_000405900 [Hibiscus trionum]|uniref:BHLH domain-containing protein n=1 Tax=Hibiscus trionum TaxID=183268 RepID=A0A9W7GYW4_HIBTR|nr:hypothetical protein HRI_000405900 [Hibiscus trionum]
MELPQSLPFVAEGRKSTHDFLTLYSNSSVQQDPRPPSQGAYLKTRDFLQLEQQGIQSAKNETAVEVASVEKPPPPSVQRILPGRIGTCSVGHTSYFHPIVPKAEGAVFTVAEGCSTERNDENSNCSSYTGSGFTLWGESAGKKGKTRKENAGETPFVKGEMRVKVDGNSAPDQKANTPRSKHSATEQRRRSKINNIFQMLRDTIPNSDQKRDKASFLLEVIEYIQFLQEKVNKYEGTSRGWSNAPSKLTPWRSNKRTTENYADQPRATNGASAPSVVFPTKLDEGDITVTPAIHESAENRIEPPNTSRATTTFRAMDLTPAMPFPVPLQPNSAQSTVVATQIAPRLPSDAENSVPQPQTIPCHTGSCTTNGSLPNENPEEQEPTIEGGTISISSTYSQRLFNMLTQALQTSGLDLSQASISVQIELGKRSNGRPTTPASTLKDTVVPSVSEGKTRPRVGCGEDSEQPLKKKLKT